MSERDFARLKPGASAYETQLVARLNRLQKESEMLTPRGLKSARRVRYKGLDADLKVSSTKNRFFPQPVKPYLFKSDLGDRF